MRKYENEYDIEDGDIILYCRPSGGQVQLAKLGAREDEDFSMTILDTGGHTKAPLEHVLNRCVFLCRGAEWPKCPFCGGDMEWTDQMVQGGSTSMMWSCPQDCENDVKALRMAYNEVINGDCDD